MRRLLAIGVLTLALTPAPAAAHPIPTHVWVCWRQRNTVDPTQADRYCGPRSLLIQRTRQGVVL